MTEPELERALTDLAAHLEHPPTPPLAEAVVAELGEDPAARRPRAAARLRRPAWPARPSWPGWRRVAVAALALLVLATGIVVATPGAREAVARRLGLRGVTIHLGGPAPTSTSLPPGVGANLALGQRVSLEDARAKASFPLLVPTVPGFDRPDAVYLSQDVPGGRVDMVYRARPGLPASPFTNVGLLITEFRAEPMIQKFAKEATSVEQVTVGRELGYWLGGKSHAFVYMDRDQQIQRETARLAGSTLVWTHGDLTLRLEGQVPEQRALRIAESMR